MDFYELLSQMTELLQREGRVSYRVLKRQFSLDDDCIEDLKEELIYSKRLAVDEDSRVLVWTGGTDAPSKHPPAPSTPRPLPTAPPATAQDREPLSYTPPHLAEKILTFRSALEGERKQVTVLNGIKLRIKL